MVGMLGPLLLAAATPGNCPVGFANGEAVAGRFTPGHFLPKLTIHNDKSGPAVVKLENLASGAEHLYFVERGATAEIRFVSVGSYRLSYAIEPRLAADCRTLLAARVVGQFDEPFVFTVEERKVEEDGEMATDVIVMNLWATLFAMAKGDATSSGITVAQFNR